MADHVHPTFPLSYLMDAHDDLYSFFDAAMAMNAAAIMDRHCPDDAPHRVVRLEEATPETATPTTRTYVRHADGIVSAYLSTDDAIEAITHLLDQSPASPARTTDASARLVHLPTIPLDAPYGTSR